VVVRRTVEWDNTQAVIGPDGIEPRWIVTGGGMTTTESAVTLRGLTEGGNMTSELVPVASASPNRRSSAVSTRPERDGFWPDATTAVHARSAGAPCAVLPQITRPRSLYVRAVKPVLDRTLALGGIVVTAIPMALIAGVVAVSMGRPVLFRQRRIGVDGQPFEVFKFRTMRPDRRGQRLEVIYDRRCTHKSDHDPRHTTVGRFLRKYSLDELPQLFNVLRGEMSVVGPRPELDSVVETYPPALHQRHFVKPGLTGLWQVSARGGGPMHENGQWDLAYVDRVSLRTDLQILVKTPRALVGPNAGT
jgi:lipopolysaccharide/colanic/teichoic acid biosynthesis glycosyltransferase